jgi:hypothetical protein
MKFHEMQIYKNINKFQPNTRNFLDLLAIQKLLNLIDVKNILEIGYREGLLFGVMYESSGPNTSLTSCDITYSFDVFRKLFPLKKDCFFHQCKSIELSIEKIYDFIVIDGDHSYETISAELLLVDQWATDDSIILVDDHHYTGVGKALTEFVQNSNFAPVLIGPQQVFFVRKGNNSIYPIIDQLKESISMISSWSTVTWNNWDIYQYQYTHEIFIKSLKNIITELDL